MLFDNVYVLAKQGVNIYWGRPDGLALHLRECGITTGTATTTTTPSITSAVDICDNDTEPDIQFPIEVLLKYSSKAVTTDERVQRLAAKTGQLRHGLRRQCAEGAMHLTPGFTRNRSKRFNFPDFYHLLLRHSLYTYVCQWRPLVAQIVFYILFLLCLTFAYNRDIGKIDGCSVNGTQFNQTCQELEHSMGIMEQNLYHQYIASVSIFTLHTAISTSFFLSEIKVFTSEHQNKWYGTGSYYWAKTLVEQILSIIFAYIYTIIMYIISGQKQESSRFYKYLYISLMAFMCSQTLGSIIGLICHRNARLALCVAVAIYFQCCEKQFLNKYEVRDHMRQHTGDRPFKCEYPDCNGAFARSNTLTQHIREVHYYKRQYFCDYSDCGADSGYDTVDQLKDHIRHRHPKHPTVPSVATV
ncbi:unnamed protein product [Medioppia subpectinata]|uniref:C2H2-type domain-containing protein n=1 Tax=Medioppia subpectinata TaxID=1979941 RepID=A0A7R9L136_9ACAR|nr:unnamed protein product [Medioppia subpectinata]CAG2113238.1 unnamed protein product [Medioppia subpectinata]